MFETMSLSVSWIAVFGAPVIATLVFLSLKSSHQAQVLRPVRVRRDVRRRTPRR